MDTVPAHLRRALQALPRRGPYVVAYSGGADSLALLHSMAALRDGPGGGQALRAVHVHHGMQPAADDWVDTCGAVCARLCVPLAVRRVRVEVANGGPEAAARRARYRALAAAMTTGEVLCTAHHRDDQAQTVLLQLARGGGPRGLAGIAPWAAFGPGWLARPLLGLALDSLAAHARQCGLPWVEDPSNDDPDRARDHLRRRVLPALREHWPGVDGALERAARHQAQAAELLDALAALDLRTAIGPVPGTLSCAACRVLGSARASNVLRHWIRARGLPPPAERHVQRILHDVLASRPDAVPKVDWPGAEIRRHGDALHALEPPCQLDARRSVCWQGDAPLELPHGRLELRRAMGRGLRASCALPQLEVRFRRGGERCRPAGRSHGQSLKHTFQEHGVPPWERGRLPLLYRDGALVAVAGLLVCEGFQARAGEVGYVPCWEPVTHRRDGLEWGADPA